MITTRINGTTFQIDGQGFLSPTEELTLEDWLHDMRAQDAATKRHRSVETVSTHRKNLREKTQQHSAAGVLAYCLSRGIIRLVGSSSVEKAAFCLFGGISARVLAGKPSLIETHFYRAQARLRTRKAVGVGRQKSAVAAPFFEPTTGDSGYYEIPAYLRKRMNQQDLDGMSRLAAYADRLQALINREAHAA